MDDSTVAQGNDGNLLQHAVESELGGTLYARGGKKGLFVILTHGMRPYEEFKEPRGGSHKLLDDWLDSADSVDEENTEVPHVLLAYRNTKASSYHYPNSAEVIAATTVRSTLQGVVTEKEDYCSELVGQWADSSLRIVQGNWRDQINNAFVCPNDIKIPWLISLDPYTFDRAKRPAFCNNGNLYAEDMGELHSLLRRYLAVYPDGAISVFCYSMTPDVLRAFDQSVNRDLINGLPSLQTLKVSTGAGSVHGKARKHAGLIVAPSYDLLRTVQHACVKLGLTAELR